VTCPIRRLVPSVAEDGNAAAARRAQDLLDRGGQLVWIPRQHPMLGRIGQQAQDTHIDGQLCQASLGTGPVADITDGFAPRAELVPVGVRHAEELADDLDRQWHGQRLVQVRGRPVLGQVIEQSRGQLRHPGPQRAHSLRREIRLQQGPEAGVIGVLCVVAALRAAEHDRPAQPGGVAGIRVRPAKPVIGQQAAYLFVVGHQPRRVTRRGADPVDHAVVLQRAQRGRYLQRMRLLKGKLNCHADASSAGTADPLNWML
jgi:hypothetical protein